MAGRSSTSLTIADVARRAKVSPAAVSYSLNNQLGDVSRETRDRVLKIAAEMGYRPNRRGRQLRTQSHMTIGVQIDSGLLTSNVRRLTATLPLTLFQGAAAHAAERGYHIQLIMARGGRDLDEVRRQLIEVNAVDGVGLMGLADVTDAELAELMHSLDKVRLPAITLDRRLGALGIPLVGSDRWPAVRQAARRVVELGHRRIAYCGGVTKTQNEPQSKPEQFRAAFEAQGVPLPDSAVHAALVEIDAYQVVRRLMQSDPRPTCILFAGDHQAMAALEALADLGLEAPRDVSFIALNNAPYAQGSRVPLATIDQRYGEQGEMLARLLLDRIADPQAPVAGVSLLASTFIERESLGPAPSAV